MTLHDAPGSYLKAIEDNLRMMHNRGARNIPPFNYTGHPALAPPVGTSSAGLLVSMQRVGRFFDDPLLVRVAYVCQHSTDRDQTLSVQG